MTGSDEDTTMMRRPAFCLAIVFLAAAPLLRADTVELLNGIRVNGRVLSETDQTIVIRATMGSSAAEMRFPVSKVHAVTVQAIVEATYRALRSAGAK